MPIANRPWGTPDTQWCYAHGQDKDTCTECKLMPTNSPTPTAPLTVAREVLRKYDPGLCTDAGLDALKLAQAVLSAERDLLQVMAECAGKIIYDRVQNGLIDIDTEQQFFDTAARLAELRGYGLVKQQPVNLKA